MASAPIRQPRGPPSISQAAAAQAAFPALPGSGGTGSVSPGPPSPDAESLLRRNKTVATPRSGNAAPPGTVGTASTVGEQQPPSMLSHPHRRSFGAATSDAYAARQLRAGRPESFGGLAGAGTGFSVLSGQTTAGSVDGSLIRRASGRSDFASRGGQTTEETLLETEGSDDGSAISATERAAWGKGLGRQSSLPSRRLNGVNPGLFLSSEAQDAASMPPPPPRPPRRVYHPSIDQSLPSPPPTSSIQTHSRSSSHAPSHSMSSLSMIMAPPPGDYGAPISPATPASAGHGSMGHSSSGYPHGATGVSRTQSLRTHVQNTSQSMDASTLGRSASMRAPGELSYAHLGSPPPPPPPFSLATPPRTKGQLYPDDDVPASDLKRHQSLTQGYGQSSRARLERSQALLSLDQREDLRRRLAASPSGASQHSEGGHSRRLSEIDTAGIGRNLWTPGAGGGDDGWAASGATAQQLQDALDALSLREAQPHPQIGEEPAWVTNLVGMPGQPSPQAQQRQLGWDDASRQYANLGQWGGGASLQPPMNYQQQQQLYAQTQAQLKLAAAGIPVHPGMQMHHGYMPQNYLAPFPGYATPPTLPMPGAAPGVGAPLSAQDLDVIELARNKGLNPATYDCRPPYARFFVIKSYTEDDVQKSLKHEIWSSTVLGNKRLDAAYRESHDKMPIYLFFSVNGSRHFCGVAEMITPVDETQSSNVWAQDKWKGIFKVKWIFVRDVPTAALRHIRLTNTPERKPITNSRDTQELPYEAGCEVLQIFLDHQHKSKTSLLQDFAYYERLSATRSVGAASPAPSAGAGNMTPQGGYAPPQRA